MKILLALIAISIAATSNADTRVIDGDTIELDGTVYRLNGIDAPEHGQRCGDWNCGEDATAALAEIVKGREVACDPISEDRYGRVIATCHADGTDIGGSMIDKGMAWAFVRYSDVYEADEAEARRRKDGVWTGRYMPPWEFRRARWEAAAQDAPEGCPIKGNISRNGHIYHPPWSPWYGRTRIDTSKGERWFCTEAEAVAAGWRAPYWN